MARPFRIPVVAGLIEHNGKVLICQRKSGTRHGLKWEFPGGKLEPGESPQRALARELEEELGIQANVGRELLRYEVAYPKRATILLIFLQVDSFEGPVENRVFETLRWEDRHKLAEYDFLDGDLAFVTRLTSGSPPL